jgi:hypothetical protein
MLLSGEEPVMNKIVEASLDRWRVFLEDARADSAWVEHHKRRDERRELVRKDILALLGQFLAGNLSNEDFRATFDKKTRAEWDVFGLKGMSGAMFLNKLVKHVPDQDALTGQLRSALRVPPDQDAARHAMRAFLEFLVRD